MAWHERYGITKQLLTFSIRIDLSALIPLSWHTITITLGGHIVSSRFRASLVYIVLLIYMDAVRANFVFCFFISLISRLFYFMQSLLF